MQVEAMAELAMPTIDVKTDQITVEAA